MDQRPDPTGDAEIVDRFLEGVAAVVEAVEDPSVARRWTAPSVLERQLVSGLVGHLARSGVWVVRQYLRSTPTVGPVDFEGAAHYFAAMMDSATAEDHRAIRQRGADAALRGHATLVEDLRAHATALREELAVHDPARVVTVAGGHTMRLEHCLETRIVEQVVHLDDLARSLGRDPWPYPEAGTTLAIHLGIDIARRRHGDRPVLRAVYRHGSTIETFPVLAERSGCQSASTSTAAPANCAL